MVSSGSAACIAQATAGCIAGTDPDKVSRLPDTSGMKNEVIITLRSAWDRSIALTGARLVVVGSLREMEQAINANTAMIEMEFGEERAVPTAEGLVLDAGVSPEAAPSTQTFDCSPEIARIHRWSGLQDWVGRRDQRVSRENAIRFAIVAVGAAVVALSAVVVALNITGNSSPGTSSSSFSSSSNGATGSPARHSKSTPSTSGVRPSAPRTASQIPPASSTGGPPVLSSLSPSTGQAGQSVVATGMGFFSSNGDIQAYFGGVEAQTSCPSQSTCTFTVPPAPVSQTSVPVTLTTQAGTSNALIFDYG